MFGPGCTFSGLLGGNSGFSSVCDDLGPSFGFSGSGAGCSGLDNYVQDSIGKRLEIAFATIVTIKSPSLMPYDSMVLSSVSCFPLQTNLS